MSKSPLTAGRALVCALGCKVNQAECAAFERGLSRRGFVIDGDDSAPDIIIVNTCCVTERAEGKSRRAVFSLAERFPRAKCLVAGCLAAVKPKSFVGKAANVRVLPARGEDGLGELLSSLGHVTQRCPNGPAALACALAGRYSGRARALLKVQDGCSQFCSYCIVPHARGGSRSAPVSQVIAEARRLTDEGHAEITLTGVHLGMYGHDLTPRLTLAELLEILIEKVPQARFRLSSIEPQELTPSLIDLAAANPSVCRHFHLPLQSGDDEILRKMGRPYRSDTLRSLKETFKAKCPDMCLGMDVMVGFPGEDDASFLKTVALIEDLAPAYLHVFPFSPRPGTPAASFGPRVPPRDSASRATALRESSRRFRDAYVARFVGKTLEVVPESIIADGRPEIRTRSDNYLAVNVKRQRAPLSTGRFWVRIERTEGGEAWGAAIPTL
jgi:threonylcarbamoyladenosine tRNA methylthiotransferase MtaB